VRQQNPRLVMTVATWPPRFPRKAIGANDSAAEKASTFAGQVVANSPAPDGFWKPRREADAAMIGGRCFEASRLLVKIAAISWRY
jgi:hypothetical protein